MHRSVNDTLALPDWYVPEVHDFQSDPIEGMLIDHHYESLVELKCQSYSKVIYGRLHEARLLEVRIWEEEVDVSGMVE